MPGITHTVSLINDPFMRPAVLVKLTNGDWTHTILCEQTSSHTNTNTNPNTYPYPYWIVRDNCDSGNDYVSIGYALIGYWQNAHRNNMDGIGHCEIMVNEILPYLKSEHDTIVGAMQDSLR
jgi:hypothetical protein